MKKAFQFHYLDEKNNKVIVDVQPGENFQEKFNKFLEVTALFDVPEVKPVEEDSQNFAAPV